jgi:hypothetical protein
MEREATTSELAEILDCTAKTVIEWSKIGLMVKTSYGKYNLKNSLRNFAEYMRIVAEGYDSPLHVWQLRQEVAWSAAHPLPPIDLENLVLVPIADLEMQPFEVELDAAGKVVRARAIT